MSHKPRTLHELDPRQAWQLLQDNPRAVLIDVRTTMEFLFVGHPLGAINIPWLDEQDWTINPHFVAQVRKVLLGGSDCDTEGCAPLLLLCRSGQRSHDAGLQLIESGLNQVYNIRHGFEGELDDRHHRSTRNGWRHDGLPWEQN